MMMASAGRFASPLSRGQAYVAYGADESSQPSVALRLGITAAVGGVTASDTAWSAGSATMLLTPFPARFRLMLPARPARRAPLTSSHSPRGFDDGRRPTSPLVRVADCTHRRLLAASRPCGRTSLTRRYRREGRCGTGPARRATAADRGRRDVPPP